MSLYINETGTSGAPSIVFMHGAGASGWMWWAQVAALADFHCLNVDLPGHGKSNHVPWTSLADTAEQITALIQMRASNGRAHLVGLSLGAYIALVLLETYADRVDRVVISGVTITPWPNRALLNPQLWLMSTFVKRRWLVERQAKALHLPPDAQAAFTENVLAMSMTAYRRIMEEASCFQLHDALRRVNVPTLVTAGGNESKVIRQVVDVIPKSMPNAQGRLALGRGHGWNVEAPDLFNAMVRAWISGLSLPGALKVVSSGGGASG